jgi:hypothetical protein
VLRPSRPLASTWNFVKSTNYGVRHYAHVHVEYSTTQKGSLYFRLNAVGSHCEQEAARHHPSSSGSVPRVSRGAACWHLFIC